VIIALASPRAAASLDDGLERVRCLMLEAARQGAEIVCFPEAYLPGLRVADTDVPPFTGQDEARVLDGVAGWARTNHIATILGMEHITDQGRQIAAVVINANGSVQGIQVKCQLDPSEEQYYCPGGTRQMFQVNGVPFGIAICHEGFRYPETVRWAARRGAKLVFHPHQTGSDRAGTTPAHWGDPAAPYYEKAVMCRALENTIYVASINYALAHQESATCIIGPSGACEAMLPYGTEGLLVHDVDLDRATGLLAGRYAPERYPA
jgi:predicted amidohydrolase